MAGDEPSPPTISRKAAMAAGLPHYFTGKSCKRGHVCKRYVSSLGCFKCSEIARRSSRAEAPELARKYRMDWARNNPEKERASQKKSRAALWAKNGKEINRLRRELRLIDPEPIRAAQRIAAKKRYSVDPTGVNVRTQKWRQANPDKAKEVMRMAGRRWVENNPLAPRAKSAKRRAQQRDRGGVYTQSDVIGIIKMQRGRCGYCRARLGGKFHVDHVIALSRGGSNLPRNLQVLCPPCNLSKAAKDPIDFSRERGLLL